MTSDCSEILPFGDPGQATQKKTFPDVLLRFVISNVDKNVRGQKVQQAQHRADMNIHNRSHIDHNIFSGASVLGMA